MRKTRNNVFHSRIGKIIKLSHCAFHNETGEIRGVWNSVFQSDCSVFVWSGMDESSKG